MVPIIGIEQCVKVHKHAFNLYPTYTYIRLASAQELWLIGVQFSKEIHAVMLLPCLFSAVLLLSPWTTLGQFPATCNNPESLQTKTCCPNNCGGPTRGSCENITAQVAAQWELADPVITNILKRAPDLPQKGTADARYLWPTVVFERICVCTGHFWGGDCTECNFGWTGDDCNTQKTPVVRKSFARITTEEKQVFINAIRDLKKETDHWSVVIVEEPKNYSSGIVKLQNISAYDFLVYVHYYAGRDTASSCVAYNGAMVDFAHSGPAFPLWHRHFVLLFEREVQRITSNASFGLPYWQWDEHDTSPFAPEYFGVPGSVNGPAVTVTGNLVNPDDWHTVCDIAHWFQTLNCSEYWKICNPAADLAARRPVERGNPPVVIYLPHRFEVQMALAANSYDAVDSTGKFSRTSPRQSFRMRLEGRIAICSAAKCAYPESPLDAVIFRMHNQPHMWVGGQMIETTTSANDPTFYIHHSNVDRVVESWIQRFAKGNSNPLFLPVYVPVSGGHPGHNRDDYMVPFFPLVKASDGYRIAEELGYTYDELIPADIQDYDIPNCNEVIDVGTCPICDANGTCINCTSETCLNLGLRLNSVDVNYTFFRLELGLGLGLGLPLLIAVAAVIFLALLLIVCIFHHQGPSSYSAPCSEKSSEKQ